MSPRARSKSPQHAKNKESHASNQSTEVGKSPMIEYLKQVHKDNLAPHFLPFKKLAEA